MAFDPVLGDARFAARFREMRTKGNLVAWRRRWLEKRHGPHAVYALAQALPPAAREYLLDPPSHFAWVPLEPLVELDHAIVRGPMQGNASLMRTFGFEIGVGDLSTVYRLVMRFGAPSTLPPRMARTWTSYFQPGECSVQEATHRSAVIASNEPLPLYLCSEGIVGWMQGALALAARERGTGVEHFACIHRGDAGCRWRLWWP
jgi:hypothetical protein